jgi:predicted amidophosphoribosyltransferase
VVPITYAPSTEQMHTALRKYKESPDAQVRTRFSRDLLAVFWRFIRRHERCLAKEAGLPAFDTVTTVPSKTTTRDDARDHLRAIVGQHASERYRRVLRPADSAADERRFDAGRYRAPQRIDGSAVLLVDDTWTGSSAQSAAAALREAGADAVALVVIGRYINLDTALMVATMTLAAVSRTSRRSRRSAASAKANSRSSGSRARATRSRPSLR